MSNEKFRNLINKKKVSKNFVILYFSSVLGFNCFLLYFSIPSGDEEDTNHIWLNTDTTITQPPRIPRQRPSPIGPCTLNLKNHSGKKKFRRYHNGNYLNSYF